MFYRAETILLGFEPMLRRIKAQLNRSSPVECRCGARARAAKAGVEDAANLSERLRASGQVSYSCECGLDTSGMFAFVFTKDRCTRKAVEDEATRLLYEYHTKPLRKVWRRTSYRQSGWSSHNTLILEDTPQNCVDNFGNALYIRTFDIMDTRRTDSALLILQAFLDRLRDVNDVRTIEKRNWERLCASAAPRPAPLRHAKSAPSGIGFNVSSQEQHEIKQQQQQQIQQQQGYESTISTSSSNASFTSSSSNSSQLGRATAFQQITAPFAHNWPWSGVSAGSKTQTGSTMTTTSSTSGVSSRTPNSQKNANMGRLMEEIEEIPVHVAKTNMSSSASSSGSLGTSSSHSGRPALLKHSATSDSLLTSHSSQSTLRSGTFHGKVSQPAIDEMDETDSDLEDSYQRWGSRTQDDDDEEDGRLNIRRSSSSSSPAKRSASTTHEEDESSDDESSDAGETVAEPSEQIKLRSRSHRRSFFGAESDSYDSSSFGSYESNASDVLDAYKYDAEGSANSIAAESQFTHTTSEGEEERRLKQLSGSSLPIKRSREIVEERLDASELLAQQLEKVQSLSYSASNGSRRASNDSHYDASEDEDEDEHDFGDDDSEASYDDSEDMLEEELARREFEPFRDTDLLCCSISPSATFTKLTPISESGLRRSSNNPTTPPQNINSSYENTKRGDSAESTSQSAPQAVRHRMPSPKQRHARSELHKVESPSGSSTSSASPWASAELVQPIAEAVPAFRATGKSDASEEVYL